MGLNDAVYGTIRSGIIQQEPIPLIKQVLAQILKENCTGIWPIPVLVTTAEQCYLQFPRPAIIAATDTHPNSAPTAKKQGMM